MESLTPNTEVRLAVAQCFRTLTASTDKKDIITALQTLHSYLDEGPESRATSVHREEFRKCHFTRTLQFLVNNIQADWSHSLTAAQRAELWDGLFLKGPPEQALLVLMEGIGELRWVALDMGLETCSSLCLFTNSPISSPQIQHKSEPLGRHHGEVPSEWSARWPAVVLLSEGRSLRLSPAPRDSAGTYCGTAGPHLQQATSEQQAPFSPSAVLPTAGHRDAHCPGADLPSAQRQGNTLWNSYAIIIMMSKIHCSDIKIIFSDPVYLSDLFNRRHRLLLDFCGSDTWKSVHPGP